MIKKIILFLILAFVLGLCKKKDNDLEKEQQLSSTPAKSIEVQKNFKSSKSMQGECVETSLIVEAKAGLRLREEPSLSAKVITTILYKNLVDFIEDSKVPVESEGKTGTFFKVSYESNIGYAFSEFLTYSKKDETICGFEVKINEVNSETGNYFIGLTDSKNGYECNAMYATLDCFYLVFNSKNHLILDTRDLNEKPEPWKSWLNKYEIDIDAGFADDGCTFTRRYAFNIYNHVRRTIEEKKECSPVR